MGNSSDQDNAAGRDAPGGAGGDSVPAGNGNNGNGRGRLTAGPVRAHLIRLSVPMVWGIMAVQSINLADTYFVAQLGTRQLAAMTFTFPVVFMLGSLAIGLGVGAGTAIARALGEGNTARVRRLTTHALILATLVVAVLVAVGLLTIDPLFRTMGASPELLPLIRDYMAIWYWGMVFLVTPMVSNAAIRATGDSFYPASIMVLAAVINVGLTPLFVFGLWGVPRMELQGAAVSTVIARALTFCISLWLLHHRERMLEIVRPRLTEFLESARAILYVGLPASLANVITPIGVGVVTALVAAYGEAAVAAFGVASRIEAFSLIPLFALSAGVSPFIAQNFGAGQNERARTALDHAFRFSLIWGLGTAMVLALAGGRLASLFDDHPQVTHLAGAYLLIVPVSYVTAGMTFSAIAAFNAMGRPLVATGISVLRMFGLYLPLAWAGSHFLGLYGIFGGIALAYGVPGLIARRWSLAGCAHHEAASSDLPDKGGRAAQARVPAQRGGGA